MDTLKKYTVEVIATVWLVVVAVQYLSRYFIGLNVDFTFAYVGTLCLIAVIGGVIAFRAIQSFLGKR